jgi:hypothetical protein
MYDRQHPRVVEKPGDAARIDRDRRKGERERDMRDAHNRGRAGAAAASGREALVRSWRWSQRIQIVA